jgi:hypothetical protein
MKLTPKQIGAIDRDAFLRETWVKLRKFSMESTGDQDFDAEVLKACGPWLGEESLAMRALAIKIEDYEKCRRRSTPSPSLEDLLMGTFGSL